MFDARNFSRVLTLSKRCRVSLNLQVFTPLYIVVKETLRDCQPIKESLLKLDQITNDLALDLVNVVGGNNLKFIPCLEN